MDGSCSMFPLIVCPSPECLILPTITSSGHRPVYNIKVYIVARFRLETNYSRGTGNAWSYAAKGWNSWL